ncbi:phosphohydrolase [Phormidium sp. FACHB-592]|uniref:Phosphohydrolase n=1 Tax=Stenomitos frigidus AS-A4 TaxID=2933935 RepID=A0ABV0KIV3_9CYAN|nr:phosphohydrolase [Phormidium sp. FACHB-592]MBD2074711.1 phosphohydrolase [Phormidium sp. FACHB-592]
MGLSLNQLLGRAVAIAATAHQNQLDKANAPYILHPLRLLLRGQTPLEQIVAVLHDVVEDSDWTLEQLAAEGFPSEAIAALDCLTRRSDESYDDFMDRVLTNPLAMRVKRYDLEDNMTLTRMAVLTAKDTERLQRYHAVYQRLLQVLET